MRKNLISFSCHSLYGGFLLLSLNIIWCVPTVQAGVDIAQVPLFLGGNSTPLVMLVMGRDHKLYYEAYNDASDLNGDGVLDVGYKPNTITYFGYFDSNKCYTYSSNLFTPSGPANNKKCTGQWSGDFLNYLTTSRMDAMRKVLYGGYRSTDSTTQTILERSYIPQDAHSWGKEYKDLATDGYNISDYTPLALPTSGTRHLFANTTLLNGDGKPLLRVLTNSNYRIWEWVSIERPVAGDQCATGNNVRANCVTSATTDSTHPSNAAEFAALLARFANAGHLMGTSSSTTPTPDFVFNGRIECDSACNPYGSDDNYITVFTGHLNVIIAGDYQFSLGGDDATEVLIDGNVILGRYTWDACTPKVDSSCIVTKNLTAGLHTIEYHHEEVSGGDSYYLYWKGPDTVKSDKWEVIPANHFPDLVISTYDRKISGSVRTDYTVRVQVCATGTDDSCKGYPSANPTIYKPTGLLQEYGEDTPERMAFGLLSGSYKKNTSGGVLRKNIGPFSKDAYTDSEVNLTTGQFNSSVVGITGTLDKFKIVDFGGNYQYGCGWITTRPIKEGECYMWGNPVGEMMYETLRYFAASPSSTPAPTPDFSNFSSGPDYDLKLPAPTWKTPFYDKTKNPGGYSGSKCFMLTISDLPSYDSDQIPGSYFNSFSSDISMNAKTLADAIWAGEPADNANPMKFIGQSGNVSDNAPTAKNVAGFGSIRGLAPEEPTKQGSFYSAAVAYFGNTQGIGATAGKQRIETMSVVLSSPLPRIQIPVGSRTITLVPFAKSVGGSSISAASTNFQPTNQIVDFYVEKIDYTDPDNGGRPHGIFRINYEDVEQGADHDMDAVVKYDYKVNMDNTITVTLSSDYAAGGIIQYMGYVIAGTDGQDGVYLEVRDSDTCNTCGPIYFAGTPVPYTTDASGMTLPRASWPTDYWNHVDANGAQLPLLATRKFKPATGSSSTAGELIKHDPFWYAAKWGGFNDLNHNGLPDAGEWDTEQSGVPDNYFLVTNAGKLKEQLGKAFAKIQSKTGTASVVAVATGKTYGDGDLYQAQFDSKDWSGKVVSLRPKTTATGTLDASQNWDAGEKINTLNSDSRQILTYKPSADKGIPFRWPASPTSPSANELDTVQAQALSDLKTDGTYDYTKGADRLAFLRGVNSKEGTTADTFRKRSSDLGDIVNSNPVYVARPNLRYDLTCGSTTYSSFITANADRQHILYVGSNDGMLHGFDAGLKDATTGLFSSGTGLETIAYVPSVVFKNLKLLTRQDYNPTSASTGASANALNNSMHHYYVDSRSIISDACFDAEWHSVLIGRLGAGGREVFALEVTKPDDFAKSEADSLVRWELTADDDADLGYTFGGSWIVQMNNGEWAAVFGNGYNSDEATGLCSDGLPVGDGCDKHTPSATLVKGSGNAVLFIVNVKTGAVIKKIAVPTPTVCSDDLPIGSGCDTHTPPASLMSNVGLSSPYIYDVDGDGKTDWIYAGDMAGNLWKFDVRSNTPSAWTVKLLFTAKNSAGVRQPITSPPIVMGHPQGGTLVLFGTGRYLGSTDLSNHDVQSYYGIWDREYWGADQKWGTSDDVAFAKVDSRSDLRAQTFAAANVTIDGSSYRTSSANEICWKDKGTCTFVCREDKCTTDTGAVDKDATYTLSPKYLGWYIDLPYTTAEGGNERVYDDSELVGGRILFVSKAPTPQDPTASVQPCDSILPGGKSWLNMIDALSGKRLATSFIKVDEKGKQTALKDSATGNAPSSLAIEGIATGSSTGSGKGDVDYAMVGTTNSVTGKVEIQVIGIPTSSERQSWKQLEFQGN